MSNQLLIETLEREIAQEEAATNEKRVAVRVLRRREAEVRAAKAAAPNTAVIATPEESAKRSPTFTDYVLKAVSELGSKEFLVNDIYTILVGYGVPLPEEPKAKVPTVLARYIKKGTILQTFTGGGNVPNRYRSAGEVKQG